MTTEIGLSLRRQCTEDGCISEAPLTELHCPYHRTLRVAKWMTPEELDQLRAELSTLEVFTDEERRQRRIDRHLKTVRFEAKHLELGKHMAAEDGVHPGAIEQAIADGANDFKRGVEPDYCTVGGCTHYAMRDSDYCRMHAPAFPPT